MEGNMTNPSQDFTKKQFIQKYTVPPDRKLYWTIRLWKKKFYIFFKRNIIHKR